MWSPSHDRLQQSFRMELLQRRAERLRGSLWEFMKHFWGVVEPRKPFLDNWHLHVECEHLEALHRGEFRNLILNVPPGTSKSTIVSVMFPAWAWAHDAGLRVFGASYSEPLAIRDAMLCRKIILSEDYRALFPDVAIQSGNDQKTQYGLTSGGWRMATSVGGRGTGEHPDVKIIDDPHNVRQAESDAERQRALDWYDGTLASRGVIHDSATILIMQRLHSVDLTGHIMRSADYADGNWVHVVIPMEYEVVREYPPKRLPWTDPRTADGQLLWPEAFSAQKVKTLKARLGEYRAAGQLQQRPSPAGGGILQVKKFRLWGAKTPLPDFIHVLQSYDTAFTDQTANDPTAGTVYGVFETEGTTCVLILDAWTDWMKFPALKAKVMADWQAEYGGRLDVNGRQDVLHPPRRADLVLLEDKGSGISLRQELQRANVPVKAYNPGNASKTARAQAASAVLDADRVYVLESRKEPGKPVTWVRPLLVQCEEFPNGEHDDLVDTLTQALIYLNHAEFITLESVPDDEEEERDYTAQHKRNPYG